MGSRHGGVVRLVRLKCMLLRDVGGILVLVLTIPMHFLGKYSIVGHLDPESRCLEQDLEEHGCDPQVAPSFALCQE